jgi:hypothetical protein
MAAKDLTTELSARARAVLVQLFCRHHCAVLLGRAPQERAADWQSLRAEVGAGDADLGALLAAGLIERHEGAPPGPRGGRAGPPPHPDFLEGGRPAFALTSAGAALAKAMFCAAPAAARAGGPGGERPCWRAADRELRFRGEVVLRFGRSAPNQERVLGALEELGWPPQIDNPLPLKKGKRQRKRLCDTLRHLSAAQRAIHFRVSVDGRAVLWAADGGG